MLIRDRTITLYGPLFVTGLEWEHTMNNWAIMFPVLSRSVWAMGYEASLVYFMLHLWTKSNLKRLNKLLFSLKTLVADMCT